MHPYRYEAILTVACPSTIGIVASISTFLADRQCNILESAQFDDRETGLFFMRLHVGAGPASPDFEALQSAFAPVADGFHMDWKMYRQDERPRVLIMVSKFGHCLNDLLYRQKIGALKMEVPLIVSNHRDFEPLAASYGIPFHHLPVTPDNKPDQEARLLELVDTQKIDLVVLARYMQVLSNDLCEKLSGRAINIHHSFLPSFKGAKPYHQAHARGVKRIGATAHYVTPDLDEGPIIEQDVAVVEHSMTADDFVARGRDIESLVLARAVGAHLERRVLLDGNKTVVFR